MATEKGAKAPWSPATMGAWSKATLEIRVAGFPPKHPPSKSFDHHRTLRDHQPADQEKHTFCPTDREIDWTDVAGPLVSTNV
ncbi:hypothetical protein AAC387_Pa02g2174 [Persea americana]